MTGLIDIIGFKVGHAQDHDALTGCTVVLCPPDTRGAVDQAGGAPGTRETDLLRTGQLVSTVHGVLLTGGSAFGLAAADGVMRYLEEQGIGLDVGPTVVPIVPAAVIFDLAIGDASLRPDAAMGYQACLNASNQGVEEGNAGAGTGATVGKILSMKRAMKSGIGTTAVDLGGGGMVAALVVVNAFGDVVDPQTSEIIAGARGVGGFANTENVMKTFVGRKIMKFAAAENTVIGVVATNVRLEKGQLGRVARMAHSGLSRCIRPTFTQMDGDTIFTLSSGEVEMDVNIVGAQAAVVYQEAVLRAVRTAKKAGGLPAATQN